MAEVGFLGMASGAGAGFAARTRPNWRGLALAAAAHAALVPLALSLSYKVEAVAQARLVTVNLTRAAPPPPPPPPPSSSQAEMVPPATAGAPPTRFALSPAPPIPPAALTLTAPVNVPAQASASAPAAAAGQGQRPAPAAAPATISGDGLEASLIDGDPPRYPHESRRKREQGVVELLVIVGTDGGVEAISIARSSGSSRLDQAALKAVSGWRWQPRRISGQLVKVRGIVEIPFILTSGRKSHHRADCDTPDPHCRAGEGPARDHRRGRVDRRDGDVRDAGPDGEE